MLRRNDAIAGLDATKLSSIVRSTMRTLLTDKMITALARLFAVLTIHIAHGRQIGHGHGLHTNSSIQKGKVIRHIFHRLHA